MPNNDALQGWGAHGQWQEFLSQSPLKRGKTKGFNAWRRGALMPDEPLDTPLAEAARAVVKNDG